MRASLRLGLSAALLLCLAACEHSAAPPTPVPQSIWGVDENRTLVHNPSGIRVLQKTGQFHLTKRYLGEREDLVVLYAAGSEPGAVLVKFSGSPRPANETCDTIVGRRADHVDQHGGFTQRLGPWTGLAPLFAGMETGRSAVYDTDQLLIGSDLPMRSEFHILCGNAGAWIVEYRADYPRDGQGSTWIGELISATAPSPPD